MSSYVDALDRLRNDLGNLDPAVHGEDLEASTVLALVDLAHLEARLVEVERECTFWRKQVGLAPDAPLMIPTDGPPPPEAIELGRKLMEHYGEPDRSIVRKARAEAAEARIAELEGALRDVDGLVRGGRYGKETITRIVRTALAAAHEAEGKA